jgi:hypothetical protein
MKKTLIIAIAVMSMAACKKSGYYYKANFMDKTKFYSGQDISGSIITNFFIVDIKDSTAAANWYVQTDAYKDNIARCDSFWVEFDCDANDWGKH